MSNLILSHACDVLILGRLESAEMKPVAQALETLASRSAPAPAFAADVDAALELVGRHNRHPDLVIIAQNWPHEYTTADVRRLIECTPLARWICCCGAWCESDGRNHDDLWPPAVRVPVRLFAGRLKRELAVLAGQLAPLPMTAGRDEIFAFDHGLSIPRAGRALAVRIVSLDRPLRNCLGRMLTDAGYRLTTAVNATAAEVLIWDVDPFCRRTLSQVHAFHRQHAAIELLALGTFLHPGDVRSLESCGVAAVVPKRAAYAELLAALERLLASRHTAVPQTARPASR